MTAPRMQPLTQPLSDAELNELEAFLASEAVPEGSLDVVALHGLLTAVAIGPGLVLPSEWLPEIWGEQGPQFESDEDAQRIVGLVMRLYNEINSILAKLPSTTTRCSTRRAKTTPT